ncbi:MAG: hypothetical protein U9N02_01250 [Campylobacterota bacterium]|nr:hypothetical protein [Campylobacterota bacterium]
MKYILIFLLLFTTIYADKYNDFLKHLNNKSYEKACRVGKKIIYANETDEKLLSLVAQSCLKCDYIYALSMVQHRLRKTKQTRADASLFSSMVLQKKLIYQFMYDDTDISTLALPIVKHPLSDTFVAIRDGSYKVLSKKPKVIVFKKDDKNYKVYIDKKDAGRVVIEIKDLNNKIEKRKFY